MPTVLLSILVAFDSRLAYGTVRTRHRDERGEGVVSTAIALLVCAFLGTMMWFGFQATMRNAQHNTDLQVEQIGK